MPRHPPAILARSAILALMAWGAVSPQAQTMSQALQPPGWSTYVFVSTAMPRQNLVTLAMDAHKARATLVLRGGFAPRAGGLQELQRFILDINAQCCAGQSVSWVLDPRLFEHFGVRAAPTFVLARGTAQDAPSYAAVSGDMELANALKWMAQNAQSPALRARASEAYRSAYAHD